MIVLGFKMSKELFNCCVSKYGDCVCPSLIAPGSDDDLMRKRGGVGASFSLIKPVFVVQNNKPYCVLERKISNRMLAISNRLFTDKGSANPRSSQTAWYQRECFQ